MASAIDTTTTFSPLIANIWFKWASDILYILPLQFWSNSHLKTFQSWSLFHMSSLRDEGKETRHFRERWEKFIVYLACTSSLSHSSLSFNVIHILRYLVNYFKF